MPKDYITDIQFYGSATTLSFRDPVPQNDRTDKTRDYSAQIIIAHSDNFLSLAKSAIEVATQKGYKKDPSDWPDRIESISIPRDEKDAAKNEAWQSALKELGDLKRLPITKIYIDKTSKTVSLVLKDRPITGMERINTLEALAEQEGSRISKETLSSARNKIFTRVEADLEDLVKDKGNTKDLNITTDGVNVGQYASKYKNFSISISPSKSRGDKVMVQINKSPMSTYTIKSDASSIERAKEIKGEVAAYLKDRGVTISEPTDITESTSWDRFKNHAGNGIYIDDLPLDEVVKILATTGKEKGSNLIPSIYASQEVQEEIQANMPETVAALGHEGKATARRRSSTSSKALS